MWGFFWGEAHSTQALLTLPPVPQDADRFTLPARLEEGKEKCPYDPSRGYTGLIVGKRSRSHTGHSSTWTWGVFGAVPAVRWWPC